MIISHKNYSSSVKDVKVLIIFGILSFAYFWYFISLGSFRVSSVTLDGRATYFSAETVSMLHGKWAVDPSFLGGIHGECFNYHNQCLGYFGLFPSIVRIPEYLLFGLNLNRGTSFYELLADLIFVAFSVALYLQLSKLFDIGKVSQVYFGSVILFSPLLFLAVRGYMYEEAIIWGLAWLMVVLVCLLRFVDSGKRKYAIFSILGANFALQSRIIEGIEALLLCAVVFLAFEFFGQRSLSVAFAVALKKAILKNFTLVSLVVLSAASYPLLNFWKFGVSYPSVLHNAGIAADPVRLHYFQACGDLNVTRAPGVLFSYLFPNFNNWPLGSAYSLKHYSFSIFHHSLFTNNCLDQNTFTPFSVTYVFSTLLALFGVIFILQNKKQFKYKLILFIILSCLMSLIILSSFIGTSERYLSEFFPLVVVLSFFGIHFFEAKRNPSLDVIVPSLLVIQIFTSYFCVLSFYVLWNDVPFQIHSLPLYNILFQHVISSCAGVISPGYCIH